MPVKPRRMSYEQEQLGVMAAAFANFFNENRIKYHKWVQYLTLRIWNKWRINDDQLAAVWNGVVRMFASVVNNLPSKVDLAGFYPSPFLDAMLVKWNSGQGTKALMLFLAMLTFKVVFLMGGWDGPSWYGRPMSELERQILGPTFYRDLIMT